MTDQSTQDTAVLTAVFDAAVDAIIVADRDGFITRANEAAARLFGHETSAMVGENVDMLMPIDMARRHSGFMSHHLNTGDKRIIGKGRDVEGLRKDGSVFPLHLSVGRGNIDGIPVFIAILHDLSRRIATEQALARSQRLDAIGQMTGGIAHDFNNLLTVVIGNLELMDMYTTDDGARAMLADALEAAELGADLTSRLTMFARKGNLNPESHNLNDGCRATLSLLKRTLGATYEIETHLEEEIAPVQVDPTLLQTAILNLSINARDAMPKGGKLTLKTEMIEIDDTYIAQETDITQGTYARLSITDTGCGMSTEAQLRAFEPFFTTKQVGKGTGLGLAMVYGFMRQSGGHVTLYSEVNHGSTFALYFPAAIDAEVGKTTSDEVSASRSGDGQTVLIVEDNPKVRSLSVTRIRALGYETAEAENADVAYDMLANGLKVDLLFTDLMMPGTMNGYDLACKVHEEFPSLKIILTSGYAESLLNQPGTVGHGFHVLPKPYRQADLAALFQAVFSAD